MSNVVAMRKTCFVAACFLLACGSGDRSSPQSPRDGGTKQPHDVELPAPTGNALPPLAPDESFADRSLADWADSWVRWSNAPNSCDDIPAWDLDGAFCANYQNADSPVFFLQSGDPDTLRTRCKVPNGKALLVPLVGFYVDGIGRKARPNESELEEEAHEIMRSIRDLSLRLNDTVPDRPLQDWIVPPVRSDYQLPEGDNVYSCSGTEAHGNVAPSFFTGAFVLFPPLEPGTYTLEYGGSATAFGSDYVTFVKSAFTVQ